MSLGLSLHGDPQHVLFAFNTIPTASDDLLTMFWNPMLLTPYLLPFYTVTLIQCASANVAQSTRDLVLTASNSPIAPSHNG